MAPDPGVVKIVTPFGRGTGLLVDDDLVVTAGHVVQAHQPVPTPTALIQIIPPGGEILRPSSILCHPRWSQGFTPAADIAVLRLATPRPDLRSPIALDSPAAQLAVTVRGFDASDVLVISAGSVTRIAHPDGYDALVSSDLRFPSGVSGAAICDPTGTAIGLATWSPAAPAASSFVGIPFLALTLGWLRMNCH